MSAANFLPEELSLAALREAAAGCRGCSLWQLGTRTVFGEGPFDLVVVMGFVTHLDLEWQFPWFQDIRALGQACRVLVFDKRGTGLSDRSLGYGSLEERTDDIRAVMDAAGSRRAVVYGISELSAPAAGR